MLRLKMIKIWLFKDNLTQKVPLLIIAITLTIGLLFLQQQTLILVVLGDSSAVLLASPYLKTAFADHGQEVTLTLHNSSFGSLTSGGGNQVSVFTSYELNDNSNAGQTINAVMEVYAPNGTLIRTSSYPNGFIAQSAGGVEGLETTIRDSTLQSVTANVTFRNLDKTAVLSNDLRVNLNLAEEGTALTTAGEDVGAEEEALGLESELESEQDTSPPLQTGQEEGGGAEDIEDTDTEEDEEGKDEDVADEELPLPLFGNP
jgi:hypothetical protein